MLENFRDKDGEFNWPSLLVFALILVLIMNLAECTPERDTYPCTTGYDCPNE